MAAQSTLKRMSQQVGRMKLQAMAREDALALYADGVRHAVVESNRSQGERSESDSAFLDILIGFWEVDLAEAQRRLSAWQEAATGLIGIEHFKTGHIRFERLTNERWSYEPCVPHPQAKEAIRTAGTPRHS